MATSSEAMAVKSLNESSLNIGGRRFVFKRLSQRIKEINIDVYRSLVPLKSEPAEGSTFFRDCLVEYRELNTAQDFISFYEEIFPLVQTLPQIILQKEIIVSSLLSRLDIKGRLSHEPVLRLLAALSRDLLEDFIPFLQRISDTLVCLLGSGADKDPEIIEQIFMSLSYIMMYLQKYLTKDVGHVLSVTAKLRYYPRDYVREFMAASVSYLLRKTHMQQLKKGIRKVMIEVVEESSEFRKDGAAALLSHTLRITPSILHSNAETLLPHLVDRSLFDICGQSTEGSGIVLEVLILVFQRLHAKLDPAQLISIWNCLCVKITDCATNGNSSHLTRLLTLLLSTAHTNSLGKLSDYRPVVELVGLLVQTFVVPYLSLEITEQHAEVIDKILQLMFAILDGFSNSKNMPALLGVSSQWGVVFDLRRQSLLTFIEDLLKDPSVFHVFETNILRALNNLIEVFPEEVINLMECVCQKLEGKRYNCLPMNYKELPSIHNFIEKTLRYWIREFSEAAKKNTSMSPFEENRLAVLWGVIGCSSHFADAQVNASLLMDLINALDELLTLNPKFAGFPENTWQILIGAAVRSYHKLVLSRNVAFDESAIAKFLDLAKRYKLSHQILSAVADVLDLKYRSVTQEDARCQYLPEHVGGKVLHALDIFSENLCHANKEIRLSTLRILCHYEPLQYDVSESGLTDGKKLRTAASTTGHVDDPNNNVLNLLKSIEGTPISIETSREVIKMISKMQMSLSARKVADQYVHAVLNGAIGIFHNRFSHLWNPASECLAIILGQYFEMVWDRFIQYLDHFQTAFLESYVQDGGSDDDSNNSTGLVGRFKSDLFPVFDSNPSATVLCLLIQSLQKERVLSVVESRSRKVIPLFLKLLGYNIDKLSSVASESLDHKGKEWKNVLKEWLSLFKLLRNPKSFYRSQFFKDVLQYRLLNENDADVQIKVLDCLLNWRDEYLLPYSENLKNLISAKLLREELTRWSLSSKSMNPIDVRYRSYIVPIVIQILIPKVRNLKMLGSQKNARINHRRAVLGFLAELDVDELPLFFWLLTKPLLSNSRGDDESSQHLWVSPGSSKDVSSFVLKHFNNDAIKALSWKKRYGFLHVVEDILAVFDESHLNPFLDLLTNCVVRILDCCTSSLDSTKSGQDSIQNSSSVDTDVDDCDEVKDRTTVRTTITQFKDLRSLCLKIIYQVLSKYEDRDFGGEFWELFFSSVKPLIDNFKQEGASSNKPSSLFYCFLAMSKSYKLVPLLFKERNLVPDIFSILTVPSASESILSCVLKFSKNLLKMDSEPGTEDSSFKNMMQPHVNVLMCSLHSIFADENAAKRKLAKFPGKREFTIFRLLSEYVKEPSEAKIFIDILLPLLTAKNKNIDAFGDVLQIIHKVVRVLGNGSGKRILKSIVPLLVSASSVVRTSICDILDALAANDSSLDTVAKVLRELNATSEMEMDGLDYDKVTCAYGKVNVEFFCTIPEDLALLILAQAIHDMSSQELILRENAYGLLVSFIDFSSQILNGSLKSDLVWSESSFHHIVNNFLLKHMGNAMDKELPVLKAWINLLREMVLKLPKVSNLDSYRPLYSDDTEQDFFSNIVHLQKHRRARALIRFKNIACSGNLSEVITYKVFVPLLFHMMFDVQDGKDEHIRSACIDALASISSCMNWAQYYALLNRCFRDLSQKRDKQKTLVRLICSIIDHYHFPETSLVQESGGPACDAPDPYVIEKASSSLLGRSSNSSELSVMQTYLLKNLLPKIQKLLISNSDKINVNISLVALKLLKLLPGEIMDLQLPTIVHRISNFLKHRLESIRDEARSALTACLKELGLEYLQFVIKVLKGTLKRGYELHVLGYTLNFMLSKLLVNPICGKLDYCLEDILSVVENDILGDVSEEKEVDKIASKMKETRKQKSYETLKLIAQSVTFKTQALKLLSPVTNHSYKQLTQKDKSKLENMLKHIAAGIECNPSVDQTELFIFVYGLIEDGITDETVNNKDKYISNASKLIHNEGVPATHSNRLVAVDRRFSHLITAFALGVMQNYMKNLKLNKEDSRLLSLLDPFVEKLEQCLSSKYENIVTAALRCLSLLVRLPLPSLQSRADKMKNSLLVIAQGSINASSQLTESCVKLLTTLLRSTRVTLSADQLHLLIQFPLFVDLAKNPSFVALSLLKAIVHRKLVVPEIYDVVQIVAELMVQSQLEPIRKKCGEILLQFLLGYHLSEKRLQQHLDFLLANLRYEHSTGREAVLEMLHAIIVKFPQTIVDAQSQTIFMHLVVSLANDEDSKVRSMTAAALKCLIGHVSANSLHYILEYSQSWYLGGQKNLWGAAAQVLGLLVEVMGKDFQKHLNNVLTPMRNIFQSAACGFTCREQNLSDEVVVPLWKEAYYSMVMFEKILHQFHNLFFDKDLEDVWEIICQFLLHPHLWVRNISNRVLSLYFAAVTDVCRENRELSMETFVLMKLSKLFLAAVSFCCQLKSPLTDDAANTLIMQNLVFSICSLYSVLENTECADASKFWSNLEHAEQETFLNAFGVLDPRKGRRILGYFTSDFGSQQNHSKHPFLSYLLQRMGKIALQMEASQMKIVFNCFKLISPRILGCYEPSSSVSDDPYSYAYLMLLPLYKVQEGYTGRTVTDDLKQSATEVSESIRGIIGMQNFINIKSQIMKNLKVKRDRRKQEEKIMAVVNPTRNAKRKLKIAAKHQANKKRKIMTMKMGRWMR